MLHSWPVLQLALLVHPEAVEELFNGTHTKLTQSSLLKQSAAVKQVVCAEEAGNEKSTVAKANNWIKQK